MASDKIFRVVALAVLLAVFFAAAGQAAQPKRVLYVDSYHAEYIWSADITKGIRSVLDPREDVELKIVRMDTKRNKSEKFMLRAAGEVRALIDRWRPDVVIASDDNASKYVISKYYRGSKIPFVFCGLNWDAGVYGFPAGNVTGMLEVALVEDTLAAMIRFAKGKRVGYLASDTASERKEYDNITRRFKVDFNVRFAKTFSGLKDAFLQLQKECDVILIQECRSVEGFDHDEMVAFVQKNTSVPTGAMQKYLIHYALLTFSKVGEEQGEWAAQAALRILGGVKPSDIPVAENRKAKIYLNMAIAKRLDVIFPVELLEQAVFTSEASGQ